MSTEKKRHALFHFCAAMRKHAPEVYDEQWGPYLGSLRLPAPFLELPHEDFTRLTQLLPGARATVELDIREIDGDPRTPPWTTSTT